MNGRIVGTIIMITAVVAGAGAAKDALVEAAAEAKATEAYQKTQVKEHWRLNND